MKESDQRNASLEGDATKSIIIAGDGNVVTVQMQPDVPNDTQEPTDEPNPHPNPYRGLEAFREEHVRNFFGRDDVILKLQDVVCKNPLVAVIGASGSGKSSLVFAGLVPKLRQNGQWVIADFRPKTQPFVNLALSLIPLLYQDKVQQAEKLKELAEKLSTGTIGLPQIIQLILQEHQNKRLLLIADQFEELYTLNPDKTLQQCFADRLLQALSEPCFSLLLTMRADFMSQAIDYRPFAEALNTYHTEFLAPMSEPELRKAIEMPAENCGVKLESGLTDLILKDLGNEPGNLPLLEFALTQLWEKQSFRQMTHQAYSDIGGVNQALARHADKVYAEFDPEEQLRLRQIFVQLVRPGQGTEDTRQVATYEQVKEENRNLIAKLADKRLIVTGRNEETGEETIEVVHEALIKNWEPLKQWMNEEREFRVWQERLRVSTNQWKSNNFDEGALLRGAILIEAESWLGNKRNSLSQQEQKFIETSIQAYKKYQLRKKIGLVSLFVAIAIVALSVSILWKNSDEQRKIAVSRQKETEEQRKITLSRQLATQAMSLLDTRYDQALLLSLEANNIHDTFEGRSSLLRALQFNPNLIAMMHFGSFELSTGAKQHRIKGIAFSPNGKMLFSQSGFDDKVIILWDVFTHRIIAILKGHKDTINCLALSPNGHILASGSYDRTIIVWDVSTRKQITQLLGHHGSIKSVAFHPSGKLLASLDNKGTIMLWDSVTYKPINSQLKIHSNHITSMAFSPDGKILAVADDNGKLIFWDIIKHTPLGKPIATFDYINNMVFSPKGDILACSTEDSIILWNILTRQPLKKLTYNSMNGEFGDLTFNSNGHILSSIKGEHIISWDTTTYKPIGLPFKGHLFDVGSINIGLDSLAFSPDDKTIASVGWDNNIMLWDIYKPRSISMLFTETNFPEFPKEIIISPNCKFLALYEEEGIILWNIVTKEIIYRDNIKIKSVVFSPDSQYLILSYDNKSIKLFNLINKQFDSNTNLPDINASVLAFKPNSSILACGNRLDGILLWDIHSGQLIKKIPVINESEFCDLAFHPSKDVLIAIDQTGKLILWSFRQWTESKKLFQPLNTNHITGDSYPKLTFNPTGDHLLITGEAESYVLWSIPEEKIVKKFNTGSTLGAYIEAAFSPDRIFMAWGQSSNSSQGVHLLDSLGRQSANAILKQTEEGMYSFAFSHDGKTFATLEGYVPDRKYRIYFWDFDIKSWQDKACKIVNRNFTRVEWAQFMGNEPYRKTCPELPVIDESSDKQDISQNK